MVLLDGPAEALVELLGAIQIADSDGDGTHVRLHGGSPCHIEGIGYVTAMTDSDEEV